MKWLYYENIMQFQGYNLMSLYLSYSVVTLIQETSGDDIPFPDLTFCNLSPLLSKYNDDYE